MNTYRNTINTAERAELIEIIEYYDMNYTWSSYPEYMDTEDLRANIIEHLEEDGEWLETIEADILDDIYNGNWDDGAARMRENYISIYNLIDYIEEYNEMVGYSRYSFFDLSAVAGLMDSLKNV